MNTSHPPSALVRHAAATDVAAIEALLVRAELPTIGVAELVRHAAGHFLVAEDDQKRMVGVVGLEVAGTDALLRSVAVAPEWRSTGIGGNLMQRAIAHAEAHGIRALYLLTTTADRYFPRFGFQRVDRQSVPAPIAATVEFASACPASAVTMMKSLA